jgi:hypothetical protein
VYKTLGSPIFNSVSLTDRAAGERWVAAVAAWEFDTICCAHLTPAFGGARAEFDRCFGALAA